MLSRTPDIDGAASSADPVAAFGAGLLRVGKGVSIGFSA